LAHISLLTCSNLGFAAITLPSDREGAAALC
jgi:hypothetical protein